MNEDERQRIVKLWYGAMPVPELEFEKTKTTMENELTVKYCGSNIPHESKAKAMRAAKKLSKMYEPNRYTACKCLSCEYWHVKQLKIELAEEETDEDLLVKGVF